MLRNTITAVQNDPIPILKCTLIGAGFGFGLGLISAETNREEDEACRAGQYILDHASEFNCSATGDHCPRLGTAHRDEDTLKIDCNYNNKTEESLMNAALKFVQAAPWSKASTMGYIIAPIAGALLGATCGFALGVKLSNHSIFKRDKANYIEMKKQPEPSRNKTYGAMNP